MTKYLEVEGYDHTSIMVFETRIPIDVGRLAVALAERFGVLMGQPDGEDTAGRQQFGLMHPTDVAKRACDVAAALWKELEDRQWVLALPDLRAATARKSKLSVASDVAHTSVAAPEGLNSGHFVSQPPHHESPPPMTSP